MKETRDPPRLKLGSEGPLKDALSALENGEPSAQSMARMSERLSPLFQAPPPGYGPASLIKLGALVVIAASTWFVWSAWRGSPASMRALPNRASTVVSTAPPVQQPTGTNAAQVTPASSAIEQRGPAAIEEPEPRAADLSRSAKRTAPRRPAVSNAKPGAAPVEQARPAPEAQPALEPVANETASSSASSGVPDTREQAVAEPPALDEAALLHKARALAKSDPRAALRLVAEHERRFPSGMLVQERELLAVELLRALSREREARARLQAFRARFPDSIYLRRIGASP